MKKGPMSAADKDYLIANKTKTLKFLSKKLNRSEETIQNFLESLQEEKAEIETTPDPKSETLISTSLVRNKKYGAVVMTPTSSMISDENRKTRIKKNDKMQKFIHIMNPKEK